MGRRKTDVWYAAPAFQSLGESWVPPMAEEHLISIVCLLSHDKGKKLYLTDFVHFLTECSPSHFKCRSGRCVLASRRCDGQADCEDDSDEDDCGK